MCAWDLFVHPAVMDSESVCVFLSSTDFIKRVSSKHLQMAGSSLFVGLYSYITSALSVSCGGRQIRTKWWLCPGNVFAEVLTCQDLIQRLVWFVADYTGEQGGLKQSDPGGYHRGHWWGQHRRDDTPGSPKQDQVCQLQSGSHHAKVECIVSAFELCVVQVVLAL